MRLQLKLVLLATGASLAGVAACESESRPHDESTPVAATEEPAAVLEEAAEAAEADAPVPPSEPQIIDASESPPTLLADASSEPAEHIAVSWSEDGGLVVWATEDALLSQALDDEGDPTGPVHRVEGAPPGFTKMTRMPLERVGRGYLAAAPDLCAGQPCVRVDAFDASGEPVGSPARARGRFEPRMTVTYADADGDEMVVLVRHESSGERYRSVSSLLRFRFGPRGPTLVSSRTLSDSARNDDAGPGDVAFHQGRVAALLLGSYSWCHFDDRDEGMPCDEQVRGLLLWIDGQTHYFREDERGLLHGFGSPETAENASTRPRRVNVAWAPDGAVVGLINTWSGGVTLRWEAEGPAQVRSAAEGGVPAPFDRPQPSIHWLPGDDSSFGFARSFWTGQRVGPAFRAGWGYANPSMSSITHDGDRVVFAWITNSSRRVEDHRPVLRTMRLPDPGAPSTR